MNNNSCDHYKAHRTPHRSTEQEENDKEDIVNIRLAFLYIRPTLATKQTCVIHSRTNTYSVSRNNFIGI